MVIVDHSPKIPRFSTSMYISGMIHPWYLFRWIFQEVFIDSRRCSQICSGDVHQIFPTAMAKIFTSDKIYKQIGMSKNPIECDDFPSKKYLSHRMSFKQIPQIFLIISMGHGFRQPIDGMSKIQEINSYLGGFHNHGGTQARWMGFKRTNPTQK